MAVQRSTHPSADTLKAFGLGKLDETSSGSVMSHLDQCDECRQKVTALSGDDFLQRLRQAQSRGSTPAPAKSLAEIMHEEKAPSSRTPIPNLPPELANNPHYEILRELGRGGMGVVYLAHNKLMDRLEVLKVVNKTLLDHAGAVERFLREIRAAAKLSHANVVAAYSAVRQGELLAFAMEYVEGQDLASLVKSQGPLPITHACFYVQQAALGLQHAFEKNMVHRDIKPQNLILAREGKKHVVKVLDFGLAKVMREKTDDTGLTGEGRMLGTPDYIAPEQTLDAAKADIRADIYSLGCTLYFLLSGRPPFSANSLGAILLAHQMQEAKPLNLVRPEVPEELAAVVRKMMAKSPAQRYQTPREVAQALIHLIKPGAAPRSSPELSVGPVEPKPAVKKATRIDPPAPVVEEVQEQPEPEDDEEATPKGDNPSPAARRSGKFSDLTIGAFLGGDTPKIAHRKNKKVNKRPASAMAWTRKKWFIGGGISVGVLLLALLGMWAAGVFKVKTKEGTLVLENVPANAEVTVDGDRVMLSAGDGKPVEVRVAAGKKLQVQVKKEGFKVFGQEVEIDAGGRLPITVRLEPALKVKTKEGTLVLENVPANAEVTVDGDRVTLSAGDGKPVEVRVAAGKKHQVQVKKEGFKAFGQEVEIETDGRLLITVRLEPAPIAAPGAPLDTDRRAAEWVLSLKGTVKVRVKGEEKEILAVGNLPADRFQLLAITLMGKPVGDEELAHLKGLTDLARLLIWAAGISDAGLAHLQDLTSLTELYLFANPKVTDAGLIHLKNLTRLRNLDLNGTGVTDVGMEHLKVFTNLTELNLMGMKGSGAGFVHLKGLTHITVLFLAGSRVDDSGLAHLESLGNLKVISLDGTRITDAGLVHLQSLKRLEDLFLLRTKVTEAGVTALQKALPACCIRADPFPGADGYDLTGGFRIVHFGKDGPRVLLLSKDDQQKQYFARVYDLATGQPLSQPLKHQGQINRALFSPDGRRVVTASFDKTARVWDAATGQALTPPLKHGDRVGYASFSPDGQRVVTTSFDKTARVWDAATGKALTPPLQHGDTVFFASFGPNGKLVITASQDRTARVWNAANGQAITDPLWHESGAVVHASVSPEGRRVVTTGWDHTARLRSTKEIIPPAPLRHQNVVRHASFSPDGRRVLTASADNTARLWDAATGKALTPPLQHGGGLLFASFSPDGRRVVTAGQDNTARVWDATNGQAVTPPLQHGLAVPYATFSPDGKSVVTISVDQTARLWDAATGKELKKASIQADAAAAPSGRFDRPKADYDALATGRWVALLPSQEEFERLRSQKSYMGQEPKFERGTLDTKGGRVIFPTIDAKNLIVRARVKKLSPKGAGGPRNLGLSLRQTQGKAHYSAWFNGGGVFGVGKFDPHSPPWKDLVTCHLSEDYDEFFEFAFAAVGDKLTVYANGKKILEVNGPEILEHSGRIFMGGEGLFQNIEVQVLDPAAKPASDESTGFRPLFNGKDLTGWKTHPRQPGNWRIVPGTNGSVLTGSGPAVSHLYSKRNDYQDFHLRVEARINDGGNSGVYFRTRFGPKLPTNNPRFLLGYEAQINSTHGDVNKTGSLYAGGEGALVSIREAPVPPDQWFTMEVIVQGYRIIVKVNGKTTADFTDEKRRFTTGHIALQQHNPQTVAEFRKIEIKELPAR